MSDKKVQEHDSNNALLKLEDFGKKYAKQLLIGLGIIIVAIGGWYGYQSFIVAPQEEQAESAIYKAEANFRKDSLVAALKGSGTTKGFLSIINNYGSTKAGNLAKYYAGLCYLRTGDFNNAVKYLGDFSTDAKQIQMMAYGALGDAYSELKKSDDVVSNYKKAAATFPDDEVNASEYLFRAGLELEVTGKTKEAVDVYKEVKEKFPLTQRGSLADKYIYRLSIEPNDFSSK